MLQLSRTMLKCRQWQYSRWGSTWTPLAKAFNSPPVRRINITRNDVGLFCLPDLRSFEGFFLLRDNVECRTQQLISGALSDTILKFLFVFIYIGSCDPYQFS